MGIERINRRSSIIGGTGLGGRQQSPLVARGPMFAGYDIPPQEVAELYKLYTQTGGPSWIKHTNWFENKTCATWFGLTVAGGRVTKISCFYNNLIGPVANINWSSFAALIRVDLQGIGSSPTNLLSGDISGWTYPNSLEVIEVHTNPNITGIIDLSRFPSTMTAFYGHTCPLLRCIGGGTSFNATGFGTLRLENMGSTADDKNSIIERIYADRALFTNAAHTLNIYGGPALTGTYQAANPPTTPAEKAFSLVNDNLGEGFLKWAITL